MKHCVTGLYYAYYQSWSCGNPVYCGFCEGVLKERVIYKAKPNISMAQYSEKTIFVPGTGYSRDCSVGFLFKEQHKSITPT